MKRTLIATLVASAFAAPAVAGELPVIVERQFIAAADDAKAHAEAMRKWSEDFSREMRESITTLYGPRLSSSAVVKGAPYSAEVVTETNQMLADGNVINRKKVGTIHRDSEGRTRQETATEPGKGSIYISDPVDGKSIVLLQGTKRAIVTPRTTAFTHVHSEPAAKSDGHVRSRHVYKSGGTEVRIEDGKVFVDGKEVAGGKVQINVDGKEIRVENGRILVNGREMGRGPGVVVRSVDEKETGDGTRREEVRVQVIRSDDAPRALAPLAPVPPVQPAPPALPMPAPLPHMPGVQTMHFESTAKLGKGTTTQLGTKDFDGVRAEGKSTVWVIPAGQIGNRNPIQVTSESWYSPDLKVTVYSRHHDPRTGESIYRLASIRRSEPPKDLFAIPEGYETRSRGRAREEGK